MSKELNLQPDEILEPAQVVAKVSRVDDVTGTLMQSGAAGAIAGVLFFAGGVPLEGVLGITALTGAFAAQVQSFFAIKRRAGDYLEMISPRRKELTEKEVLRAWAFLPGEGTNRRIDTFYVNEKDGVFEKRLKNGLMYNAKRCDKLRATHMVTHEIKSSWHGIEVVQSVEPLDHYLWSHAFEDVSALYGIDLSGSEISLESMKGTTIQDRIGELEAITSKPLPQELE